MSLMLGRFLGERELIQERQYREFGAYHWNMGLDLKHRSNYNNVLRFIRHIKPNRILDLGCGDGFFTDMLAREFPYVLGTDFSENALNLARQMSPNLKTICCDVRELKIQDGSFDLISSVETLEHIPVEDVPLVIKEVERVLVDNGSFVITVPSKVRPVLDKHYAHYDEGELRNLLSGFSHVQVYGSCKHDSWFYDQIDRMVNNKLWKFPLVARILHDAFYQNLCSPNEGISLLAVAKK